MESPPRFLANTSVMRHPTGPSRHARHAPARAGGASPPACEPLGRRRRAGRPLEPALAAAASRAGPIRKIGGSAVCGSTVTGFAEAGKLSAPAGPVPDPRGILAAVDARGENLSDLERI